MTQERGHRTITVIGLGAMGTPMARRLAARGYEVLAVDPYAAARTRAERDGMRTFEDIASVPKGDVVLVVGGTGQQRGDAATSVGPQAAREAAEVLTEAGAAVVDAPVSAESRGRRTARAGS